MASLRSRSAGTVVLQGLPNKQLEMLVPSFTGGGPDSRPILALWRYENQSVALTYLDHRGAQCYILWDAATNLQHNFDAPEEFHHELLQLGMEAPDQLDRVLSKRYRPRNAV